MKFALKPLWNLCVGEKYELAKKLKKIKLVNHRWLEDWYAFLIFLSTEVYIVVVATSLSIKLAN